MYLAAMRFISLVLSAIALQSFSAIAAVVGRSGLEARDNVGLCVDVLIALEASAFCSAFVPITDVIVTKTGAPAIAYATVTAPCTSAHKKRQASTRPPPLSTTPAAPSTVDMTSIIVKWCLTLLDSGGSNYPSYLNHPGGAIDSRVSHRYSSAY